MKEGNSIVERKRKLGRVVLNKNPLEKSDRKEVAAAHGRSAGLGDFSWERPCNVFSFGGAVCILLMVLCSDDSSL